MICCTAIHHQGSQMNIDLFCYKKFQTGSLTTKPKKIPRSKAVKKNQAADMRARTCLKQTLKWS